MPENSESKKRSVVIIIGGMVLGVGAGFFFFPVSVFGAPSVFAFTGCILCGFGLGLMVTSVLEEMRKTR